MRAMPERFIYYATAPICLFGRSPAFRLALGALVVVALFFTATLWALDRFFPESESRAALAKLPELPPLPPVTRASYVIAPVAIAISAIGRTLDAAAPRDLVGKNDNPVSGLLSKADIGITVARGTMSAAGRPGDLTVTMPITGNLRITGQIATQAGNLAGGITGLLNSGIGQTVGKLTSAVLDQRAEVRGQAVVHSRPALTANWRLEPNFTAQLTLGDSAVTLAGLKIDVANEARPLIEREVNVQVSALQARLRNDPFIERAAREQWTKMCRALPLGGGKTGLPALWLEMRPIRAAAAQPQIDARNMTLTVGVQAETRIVTAATKPTAVPGKTRTGTADGQRQARRRRTHRPALHRPQQAAGNPAPGKRFPDDASAPVEVEVLSAAIGASGDRLLILLRVKAHERRSWFGFGAQATVQIWGKPVLDRENQILRLTDLSLAVDSQTAFGLLGSAARAAMPYLQQALADNAVLDLKPFAADAKTKITAALANFRKSSAASRSTRASTTCA